ncbi:MAG: bifunctional demethylmenaquinone methyltransferase/2-methoxy-6-polyprenyl-1,4-benzoquinol methylase UbiE [Planctomycetes bacterium]|nr:bifunctional demethylmenaquinone methyltransferase/2-methoxy-6-polyprenyl-1,4-benzoquinol methylase UbiE [Planctomycetota bacterium]
MPERTRIRGMFGTIAPRYDFLNHLLSMQIDRLWRRRVVRRAEVGRGQRVLDACTGTGDLAFALAQSGCAVVGGDFTPQMLSRAEAKRRERGARAARVRFVLADAMNLPFEDDGFDAATVAFGIRNVEDVVGGLREMTRVVKPGGRVLVLEFSRPPGAIFRSLYLFYFRRLLPRVGAWFARRGGDAYRYLPDSVMGFPDPEELARLMREAGLGEVRYERLTRGIATLHLGIKPARSAR